MSLEEPQRIGALGREDAVETARLEQMIFGMPWSEKQVFKTICQSEESRRRMEEDGTPPSLSYGSFGLWKEERLTGYLFSVAVAGEGELHRIAVHPEFRKRGIADQLMTAFFSWLEGQKAGAATLEVRAGNSAAIALYEKYGFKEEGRRRAYYKNPVEDALIFWCHQFPLSNSVK